jgi:hypothetical protein
MATKDVTDVELCATGTWRASTGETTITRADLEAMLAARDDVDHAPVRLGHRSSLNAELGDGAPAYGWVVPTRIENRNGRDVLIGDLKDVPAKLAEAMPSAYRRRSAEIGWRVNGVSGVVHKAALVGIALLGIAAPAVKGLADALSFHSEAPEHADTISTVTWLAEGDTPALNDPAPNVGNDEHMTDGPKEAAVPADPKEQLRSQLDKVEDAELKAMIQSVLDADGSVETPVAAVAETTAPAAAKAEGGEVAAPVVEAPRELATAGTVTLSEAVFKEMEETVKWAKEQRRTALLAAAVGDGRLSPAERNTWEKALIDNEAHTTSLLSSLTPRYSVSELGADQAPENPEATDAAVQAYITRPAY